MNCGETAAVGVAVAGVLLPGGGWLGATAVGCGVTATDEGPVAGGRLAVGGRRRSAAVGCGEVAAVRKVGGRAATGCCTEVAERGWAWADWAAGVGLPVGWPVGGCS